MRVSFSHAALAAGLFLAAGVTRAEPDPARIAQLFTANCAQCHLRPETAAPLAGNAAQWAERVKKGEAVLMQNLVEGLGGMPPLGYCAACTEDELRALLRLLTGTQELPP